MSSEMLRRAVADAQAAERQAEVLAVAMAAVQAMQAAQAAPHAPACGCHSQPARRPRMSGGQIVAVAAGVCACGAVATAMFLAVALTAVAVSVSALVALLLVREIRKGSQ